MKKTMLFLAGALSASAYWMWRTATKEIVFDGPLTKPPLEDDYLKALSSHPFNLPHTTL